MEISLERKFITEYGASKRVEKICEANCDIVVPDTKEDILRVLLTTAKYKLRSKDIENGKVVIRGELEINSVYVPEASEGIDTLNTDTEFECGLETGGAEDGSFAMADISVIAVDTRILNPRKISVSIKLLIGVRCYTLREFEWYQKPENCECKAFFRNNEIAGKFVDIACEKTYSLENDFDIPDRGEDCRLLSGETDFTVDSADAVGSKLIVKGHADIKIMYLSAGKIMKAEKTTAFSQIFELTERDTLPDHSVSILQTGDYYELQDGVLSYEIHAVMQIVCIRAMMIPVVCDAYVCGARAELSSDSKSICTKLDNIETSEMIRISKTCDRDVVNVETVTLDTGKVRSDGKEVSVPIIADVIYSSSDDKLYSCRLNTVINTSFPDAEDAENIKAEISDLRASYNGNEITVTAGLNLRATVMSCCTIECITDIKAEEINNDAPQPSLYLARNEGNLWELAKKYGSDLELIKSINGIEDGIIPQKLLIIPQ